MSRRAMTSAGVFVGYLGVSILYFGIRLLPHPGRSVVGFSHESQIFVWSFGWWPHALSRGDNPIVTHAIWAPDGVNLAWAASMPALAVFFAPLTAVAGAIVSYNAAALAMPALAAWTCYLLCRHVVGGVWPPLVGGYSFGFSSYMLGQELGHLHLTAVFLVPLVALLVIRYVERELSARGLAWRLGIVLGLQLWLSTEVFVTIAIALAFALTIALATVASARPRLRTLARPLGGAFAIAFLIGSPLLVYALRDFESKSLNRPSDFSADVLNFVVPSRLVAAGGGWASSIAEHFPGNDFERGAYLGLPTLVIVGWFALRRWHQPGGRFLVVSFAAAVVAAAGTSLHIAGDRIVPLPWGAIAGLPAFNNVLPVRLSMYASLSAAVIVALWMRSQSGRVALALPALAVLALVPRVDLPLWTSAPERPAFFTNGTYKTCLQNGENVFTVPFGEAGDSMVWQVDADFGFRLAGGYIRPGLPNSYAYLNAVWQIHFNHAIPSPADLNTFFRAKNVTRAVVAADMNDEWRPVLRRFGAASALGGVVVYPRCGPSRTLALAPGSSLATAAVG